MSVGEVEYKPRLVEEAVMRALVGSALEREFRRRRNPIYEIDDPERREAAFQLLHAEYFERLELNRPLGDALSEFSLRPLLDRCLVVSARGRAEEGAELFVAQLREGAQSRPARSLVIRLRPELLLEKLKLLEFLRDELMHIADMLDPAFGYRPSIPSEGPDPARDQLLVDRVRVLWNTTVAGRLARREQLSDEARERRLREFLRAFPMLGDGAPKVFSRFFDGWPQSFAEMVVFARAPAAEGFQPARMSCPLCHGLMAGPGPGAGHPLAEVQGLIRRDFPAWEPAQGICPQCAELYRARAKFGTGSRASSAGRGLG